MSHAQVPAFEALIVPYRSLNRRGVFTVVAALSAFTGAIGLRFWLLGAWPVVVFSLIEIPLVILLLAINVRRARARELIMLDSHELKVIRTDPNGRRKQVSLPSAWLRVDLTTGKGIPRVVLSSHGRGCEVGAFLHEAERLSLFGLLREALDRLRHPVFQNAQLQETPLPTAESCSRLE